MVVNRRGLNRSWEVETIREAWLYGGGERGERGCNQGITCTQVFQQRTGRALKGGKGGGNCHQRGSIVNNTKKRKGKYGGEGKKRKKKNHANEREKKGNSLGKRGR